MSETRKRVLIGSPVRQKPIILREFLLSIYSLRQEQLEFGYFLIDDTQEEQASAMLREFAKLVENCTVLESVQADDYTRNEVTHFWNEHLIWKVAEFKNNMIQHALDEQYDYLFLVDSDLLLHPLTVEQLLATRKDIVSEIFWTSWQPDSVPQPQVWLRDEYTQWEQQRGENLSEEEISVRYDRFISQLKVPGVYEVGGLGACTLISRNAMIAGVNFKPIQNLSFWGEDRHFCVRASAIGFSLYVDSLFPAYHIYRESDLNGVHSFKLETGIKTDLPNMGIITANMGLHIKRARDKLTLTMVVKNEGNRYLKQVLEEHRKYIDEAVIIDDGSIDNTVDVCLKTLQGIPVKIVRNEKSKFSNEIDLRKQQWEETIKTNPDWILNLDADEIFEGRFATEIQLLLQQTEVDVHCFRLYDLWSETQYREDPFWQSHLTYRPFLIRYRQDFLYKWKETPQHCGRFPENIFELPHRLSNLRLKHLGWVKPEHRIEKYQRYMLLDPEAKYGWKEQYLSILDKSPNLIPWIE